jgi:hypothetical protein
MRGIETGGDSEMAYRRGYERGVIELFYAIKRFLDPRMQEGVRAWIEKDVGPVLSTRCPCAGHVDAGLGWLSEPVRG